MAPGCGKRSESASRLDDPTNEVGSTVVSTTSPLLLLFVGVRLLLYSISLPFLCAQDPHDELKGQNVLIIRGSVEETAAKFGLSLDVLRELLKTALSTMREARQGRPRPHLDDKMLAAWNGEF